MLPTFCLRLALGMMAPLVVLPAAVVPPRFFRVQFLVTLALLVVASLFPSKDVGVVFWIAFFLAMLIAVAGSIIWHTEEAPAGRPIIFLTAFFLTLTLIAARAGLWQDVPGNVQALQANLPGPDPRLIIDDLAASALLGSATSSMLMGHSYLIAPAMSLVPLMRLLACLATSLGVRIVLACFGLWTWTHSEATGTLEVETILWLSARWLLGLVIPIVLTWMAWETARIRSTQSATGILYVVTIVVFLGELLSLLLVEKTGFVL
jgi:hypothetical protein